MLEPWAMNHKRLKKRIAWSLYQRRDLKQARCHHTTADTEARNVQRLGLGVPVRVIPNGVDVPAINRQATGAERGNGRRTALFLGRIYPVKGLPMLVKAWSKVRPDGWVLQIAGPDEAGHREQVEALVAEAGLTSVISFTGPVEDHAKRDVLLGADLFVMPSYSESFGMAIAEALGHGVPVLTTTGVPWPMLPHRSCGWRVEPTVEGIAEGLRQATFLSSEALQTMGSNGRDFVASEFGWDKVARQFLQMYDELTFGYAHHR
jgi:glycosyltransferase involved in cell wall biosynthesis